MCDVRCTDEHDCVFPRLDQQGGTTSPVCCQLELPNLTIQMLNVLHQYNSTSVVVINDNNGSNNNNLPLIMFFSLNFVIMPHPPLLLLLLLMMMFGKLHSLMHAKSTGCYSTSTHTHTHTHSQQHQQLHWRAVADQSMSLASMHL